MKKGDHIKVRRLGYTHHGIYINGNEVIHFTGEPLRKSHARVESTTLFAFLRGGAPQVVTYGTCSPPETTLRRAREQAGKAGYSLLFNNCEHFAHFCKTGAKKSEQVKDGTSGTLGVLADAGVVGGGLVGVSTFGAVPGLSGAGILSGLVALGPGGAVGGIATIAAGPALATNIVMSTILDDDESLDVQERVSRRAGRVATKVGTGVGAVGAVGAISAAGAVSGLSGAGIASGLAAMGGTVGGGMLAGVAVSAAAPAAAAAAVGYGVYRLVRWWTY